MKASLVDSLEPFRKALASLVALKAEPFSEILRDASIQRFEYTIEQACRILQRVLARRGIEVASPREILRVSARDGLISNIEEWMIFVDKRNLTSHTYNAATAMEVYEVIPRFRELATELLTDLEEKL